jgi:hypothetical protein
MGQIIMPQEIAGSPGFLSFSRGLQPSAVVDLGAV